MRHHGRAARKRPKGTQSERSLSARVSNPAIHPPTARGITPFRSTPGARCRRFCSNREPAV
jgi:hypothetical protein